MTRDSLNSQRQLVDFPVFHKENSQLNTAKQAVIRNQLATQFTFVILSTETRTE